jgi:glutamate synthase (NADPH/NADH) small chain
MSFNTPQVDMPKQNPEKRRKNFAEVARGYTVENALDEAARCLQCKNPQCMKGCPVSVYIPQFIQLIKEEKFIEAAKKLKETNALPAVCGRVCPQENQCQKFCILGIRGEPIAIGRLERFAADWERNHNYASMDPLESNKSKIAIIGSGPAGLTTAAELQKAGYEVHIFESLHEAGGVLMYGIPEFRLPKDVVQNEVDYVKSLGVQIHLDVTIGRTHTIDDLKAQGFEIFFIGSGAGLPRMLGIDGENLGGIYSANEFLIRTNLMKAYNFPIYRTPITVGKRVAVIGGGNVAMDSARCALRLGAEEVYIIYRRSREELPARHEEVENADEEGIVFQLLTNPVRFIGDERNQVTGIECIRMELGEPDQSGRRRPIPIENSEAVVPIDTVVIAIGQSPNPLIQQTTKGLEVTRWGTIITDEETMETNLKGIYAGGDVVSGAATVISAMGAGKKAASAMIEYLTKNIETSSYSAR